MNVRGRWKSSLKVLDRLLAAGQQKKNFPMAVKLCCRGSVSYCGQFDPLRGFVSTAPLLSASNQGTLAFSLNEETGGVSCLFFFKLLLVYEPL